MAQIESQVELPAGAYDLNDYLRYYAFDDGHVVAVFTTFDHRSDSDQNVRTSDRNWVGDRDKLPLILDGGCSVVNIVYDPKDRSFDQVFCNGVA